MHVPNLVYSSTTNPQGHARMRLRDRRALAIKQIGIISVAVDRPKQIMIVAATPAPPTSPTARSGAWISTKLCTLNMLLIECCNKCRLQMGVAMAPAHCFFLVCPCSSQTLRKLRRCGPLSRTLSGRRRRCPPCPRRTRLLRHLQDLRRRRTQATALVLLVAAASGTAVEISRLCSP